MQPHRSRSRLSTKGSPSGAWTIPHASFVESDRLPDSSMPRIASDRASGTLSLSSITTAARRSRIAFANSVLQRDDDLLGTQVWWDVLLAGHAPILSNL